MLHRLHFFSIIAGLFLAAMLIACGGGNNKPEATSTAPAATATTSSTTPTTPTTPSTTGTPAATEQPFQGARDPVEGEAVGSGIPVLTDVRAASHTDYDRITFEFEGSDRPHYRVEYITPPAVGCGSGADEPVAGSAVLKVQFMPANSHNDQGNSTIDSTDITPGLPTLKEAKMTCDFEADVQWALGLDQEQDFRVITLDSPPRIAIDVAHP